MLENPQEPNRVVDTQEKPADIQLDTTLRPRTLTEYIGQSKIKENLDIFISAAKRRNQPIEHVLLYGPPGLGKTTLAHVIANEMGSNIKITSGPAIEKTGDLAAILTNLQSGDILFIDEIHRLNRTIEEILYPAMEDFALDIVIGQGPSARTLRLNLPEFTIIGATTKFGNLSSPLRDRFGNVFHLEFYTDEEIAQIIRRSSKILGIDGISDEMEIARRSRKTPRIANRLLKRVRDYAQVRANGTITQEVICSALDMLEIDELGLDSLDRKILDIIIDKYKGGPVGLSTIAAATAEEVDTIEDVYEPFLIQIGFLNRTPRGRVATIQAMNHLKKNIL